MNNSILSDNVSMSTTSLVKWFQENLFHPVGFMQLGAIGASYLIQNAEYCIKY